MGTETPRAAAGWAAAGSSSDPRPPGCRDVRRRGTRGRRYSRVTDVTARGTDHDDTRWPGARAPRGRGALADGPRRGLAVPELRLAHRVGPPRAHGRGAAHARAAAG